MGVLRFVGGGASALATIWTLIRWILYWLGRADFIRAHWSERGWVEGLMNLFINPPVWLPLCVLAAGLLLIYADNKIHQHRLKKAAADSDIPIQGTA